MFCNNSIHDSRCPYNNKMNNALKGGSAMINPPQQRQQRQTISFESTHVSLIAKTLELARLYVSKNSQNFQEPQDILNKIDTGINIISSKQNNNNKNSTKGASSICDRNKKQQSLNNLLNHFNLLS